MRTSPTFLGDLEGIFGVKRSQPARLALTLGDLKFEE